MASDPGSSQERRCWKSRLAHAFRVEKASDMDASPRQQEIVHRLCAEIVRRRMTVPALMALEMSRPLNRLTAAAMHMLQPMVSAVMTSESFEEFARFLEHAGSIDYLCEVLERQEADRSGEPR